MTNSQHEQRDILPLNSIRSSVRTCYMLSNLTRNWLNYRASDYLQEDQRDRQTECTGSSFSIITLFLLLAVCFETEVARSRYRAPTGVQSVRFRQSNLPLSSFILVVYTSDKLFLPCQSMYCHSSKRSENFTVGIRCILRRGNAQLPVRYERYR